jgi:hypothetical protein
MDGTINGTFSKILMGWVGWYFSKVYKFKISERS